MTGYKKMGNGEILAEIISKPSKNNMSSRGSSHHFLFLSKYAQTSFKK